MKRSRLKLFKTTSMTISVIGVVLILLTIGLIAYVGVAEVSNTVSDTVSSGSAYDQVNVVKSQFNNVSEKYHSISEQISNNKDQNMKTMYSNGKLYLSEANQTILSAQNGIAHGDSEQETQAKLEDAKKDLEEVENIYNQLVGSK